jgi:hypothetical protein
LGCDGSFVAPFPLSQRRGVDDSVRIRTLRRARALGMRAVVVIIVVVDDEE